MQFGYEDDRFSVGSSASEHKASAFVLFLSFALFVVIGLASHNYLTWVPLGIFGLAMSSAMVVEIITGSVDRPLVIIDATGLTHVPSNTWLSWSEIGEMRLRESLRDTLSESQDRVEFLTGKNRVRHTLVLTPEPPSLLLGRTRQPKGRGVKVANDGSLEVDLDYKLPNWTEVLSAVEAKSGRQVPVERAPLTRGVPAKSSQTVIGVTGLGCAVAGIAALFSGGSVVLFFLGLALIFAAFYCASVIRRERRRQRFVRGG
jgi:hypothetical protein